MDKTEGLEELISRLPSSLKVTKYDTKYNA